MAPSLWTAALVAVAFAGCLQASVSPEGGNGAARAPTLVFVREEPFDQVVVQAAEAGVAWDRLGISADPAGTQVRAEGAEPGDGKSPAVELVPGEFRQVTSSTDGVMAGDVLRFCASGSAQRVTYSIAELRTNTLVYQTTFESVASCG